MSDETMSPETAPETEATPAGDGVHPSECAGMQAHPPLVSLCGRA